LRATDRLALTTQGLVRYTLKTPYRDGTTHVIFEPLDFLARLAALVPKPRVNLTRYHGVFAPHSALRAEITPAWRGTGTAAKNRSPAERHRAMSWAQRLKRVFRLDLEHCERCGGKLKVIASIEDPAVIARILTHLEKAPAPAGIAAAHRPRGPPGQGWLEFS
jgi:Putative transposase